jgi:hypothetical protein
MRSPVRCAVVSAITNIIRETPEEHELTESELIISKLDFVHSEIGASADLRMDKVPFNC